MACPKTWKSYPEQLDLLKSRGLSVSDDAKTLEYLERIGYYRLSGYWYPFREHNLQFNENDPQSRRRNDHFKQGANFHHVVELYVFDKKLRLLLMDALERIEIALREDIAHLLGNYDPFAYSNSQYFHQGFLAPNTTTGLTKHQSWLAENDKFVDRAKNTEDSIKHYHETHGLPLPIWVACEIWDFGALSRLFAGMRQNDQETISRKYGVTNGKVFESWLHSLNYLRNVCAHHSRLWNRNMVRPPKLPRRRGEVSLVDPFLNDPKKQVRVYLLICIARHLVAKINPSSTWWDRLKEHLLNGFPAIDSSLGISVSDMGTITDWQE